MMLSARPSRRRFLESRWLGLAVLVLALGGLGCAGLARVLGFSEQVLMAKQLGRIDGRIDTEGPAEGTLVVVLAMEPEVEGDPLVGVDTFVRVNPGTFAFAAAAGRYRLGAYEDRNHNGLLDPGERVRRNSDNAVIVLGPGERVSWDIRLDSPSESITESWDVFDLVERTPADQRTFSLWAWSVEGSVCEDLAAETFGPKAGPHGLWEVMDFLNSGIAGVYFMEPYDPERIPVLFVHGIGGFPQQFSSLMEKLDHAHYQPWFYFYPSGFGLKGTAKHLATLLERLAVTHGFESMAVVAHSAGGLVSRGAILEYQAQSRRDDIRMFMSISTPWGGDVNAKGAGEAPIELPPSFADMDPSSDFMRGLFYEDESGASDRPLPPQVEFHVMFGFRMRESRSIADDGVVAVASQLRPEVQQQAATQRGFDNGHVDILREPAVAERLNALLEERFE